MVRGLLPHYWQTGVMQFVTFHLLDSLPADVRKFMAMQRDFFIAAHPLPWDRKVKEEFNSKFSATTLSLLDKGYGSCLLRRRECRQIVVDSLHWHDGKDLLLGDFVVMPNHVHALVVCDGDVNDVFRRINRFTAVRINRLTGRSGQLWPNEVYDRMIRNADHMRSVINYIANNPRFLPPDAYHYEHSGWQHLYD